MKQSFFAPPRRPFPSKASPGERILLRITGLVVIIAVRWHSLAFLRHSRTGSGSLVDLFKEVMSVMRHDEKR